MNVFTLAMAIAQLVLSGTVAVMLRSIGSLKDAVNRINELNALQRQMIEVQRKRQDLIADAVLTEEPPK